MPILKNLLLSNQSSAGNDSNGPADPCTTQILTINVEEYFQAGVFHRFIDSRNWYRFDSRLQSSVEETLAVLSENRTTATFFVLGWIAEKYPELIRLISDSGHEVASRGYLHQPLLQLERHERFEDLKRSRLLLEDVTGTAIRGFRLSDGWLRSSTLNFLEDVREAGYLYDSSLMPRHRDFRNNPERRVIHVNHLRAGELLEIPPSTISVCGNWFPIAGGNYQRQLPNALMRSAVSHWVQTMRSPFVMYFQSWEMDSEQPQLSAISRLAHIRHYRNLGKYRWLLPEYLRMWKFVSVMDHSALPGSPLRPLQLAESRPIMHRNSEIPRIISQDERDTASPMTGVSASLQRRSQNNGQQDSGDLYRRPRTTTSVTLIIPCFNEEGSLPYLSRTLSHLADSLSGSYELNIIFVDDCSRDNTRELLKQIFGSEPRFRIIHHERNLGVSAAILTGMKAAETEIVCSIDCDCSYDPHELEQMLPMLKPGVAMVTASPYHRKGGVRNVPRWRLTLSHGLSVMYRVLLRQSLATWTSCFRVYRKSLILDLPLHENGFLGTAELAAQLCLHGRPIAEHPAVLEVRLFGASKMKTLKTIASHMRLLSSIAFQKVTRHFRVRDSGSGRYAG